METNLQKMPQKTESITQVIDKYSDILDAEQIQALPLLGYGTSVPKVAQYLGIPQQRVRMWINTDPNFRAAINEFKEFKNTYHQSMLDQLGALAWDKIFEYLSMTIDAADDKMARVQSDLAKFIVSQLSLKTQKAEITHEIHPQLHVTDDSASLIAKKLRELQDDGGADIIDSEYRIALDDLPDTQDELSGMNVANAIDKFDGNNPDEEIEEAKGLTTNNYVMHPSSSFGKLEYDESKQKWRCHVCGKWTRDLVTHIRTEHKLSPARYRKMYGLSPDTKFYIERPNPVVESEEEEELDI